MLLAPTLLDNLTKLGLYSYPSRSTPEGRLAIVTCRGAGCGGRGSVGAEGRRQGAARQEVRRAWPRGLWSRRPKRGRRRCAVRAGAEMRPICIAFARRPKSCGPDARRWRQGTERLHADRPQESKVRTSASVPLSPDGDEPKRINRHRGEHEASRKPHRVRNAGRPVLS